MNVLETGLLSGMIMALKNTWPLKYVSRVHKMRSCVTFELLLFRRSCVISLFSDELPPA